MRAGRSNSLPDRLAARLIRGGELLDMLDEAVRYLGVFKRLAENVVVKPSCADESSLKLLDQGFQRMACYTFAVFAPVIDWLLAGAGHHARWLARDSRMVICRNC